MGAEPQTVSFGKPGAACDSGTQGGWGSASATASARNCRVAVPLRASCDTRCRHWGSRHPSLFASWRRRRWARRTAQTAQAAHWACRRRRRCRRFVRCRQSRECRQRDSRPRQSRHLYLWSAWWKPELRRCRVGWTRACLRDWESPVPFDRPYWMCGRVSRTPLGGWRAREWVVDSGGSSQKEGGVVRGGKSGRGRDRA
jgi:hypothetical protein